MISKRTGRKVSKSREKKNGSKEIRRRKLGKCSAKGKSTKGQRENGLERKKPGGEKKN